MTREEKWTPFQRALVDSVLQEYDESLSKTPEISPSAEFEHWGQDRIRKGNRAHTAGRVLRGILIAAIITALLAISAMAIPAVRESIINFFLQEHTDHYGITFDPEQAATAPDQIVNQYHLSYTPDGYILVAEDVAPVSVALIWMEQNGGLITFTQWRMPEDPENDTRLGLNNGGNRSSVVMREYLVEWIQHETYTQLVWTNNEYYFVLEVPSNMPQEEINKIFASWGPKESS